MKSPLITVIVTAYNAEQFLARCLESLCTQTLANIEVICVDDGSSDKTPKILQDYADRDQRIVAISQTNQGVSHARNLAIDRAKSDYIMFCDADDYYDPTMCEKMLAAISDDHHQIDLAISEIQVTYEAHHEMKLSDDNYYSLKFNGLQHMRDEIILQTDLSPTNKIFRRALLRQYDLRFPEDLFYEDAYFCAAYFCISQYVYFLPEQLYHYIRHPHSTMSDTWSKRQADHAIDHLTIAIKLYDFLAQHQLIQQYNVVFWQLFLQFLHFALRNSKTKSNLQAVRSQAKAFIAKQQSSFDSADPETRRRIKRCLISRYTPSVDKLKQILLRFMPTYRLQGENLVQLRRLELQSHQLSEQLQRLEAQNQKKP